MSSPTGVPAKVCVQCGQDCSNKPRTKDPQGRYTCKACFDALAASARDKSAPAKAAIPAPAVAVAAEPTDDGIMALLLKDSAPAALTETCPSCGSGLVAGSVVCTICGYNKQTGKTVRTGKGFAGEGGETVTASAVVKKMATAPLVLALSALGALVGGFIGAVVWTGVAYGLDREISWVAIGVGIATGIGAAVPAGNRAGVLTGLIAAVVAVLAVAGGKFAAASMVLDEALKKDKDYREASRHKVTDEELVGVIARDVAKEHEAAGTHDQWPQGVDQEDALKQADFPTPVWADAKSRFDGLSQSAKDERRTDAQDRYDQAVKAAVEEIKTEGFMSTFSPFDILWFLLAIVTAFGAGSGARNGASGEGWSRKKAATS